MTVAGERQDSPLGYWFVAFIVVWAILFILGYLFGIIS